MMLLPLLLSGPALAVDLPDFSAQRGVYDAAFVLEVSPTEADATVLCSTDRTAPATPCTAVDITGTSVVRAQQVAADGSTSLVATHTYVFPQDVLTSAVMNATITGNATYAANIDSTLRDLPILSLVLQSGVSATEQQGSFEWIDPTGDVIQVDCGVREVGGTATAYAKDTLRLNFRSRYGASRLDADLYGGDYTGVAPTDSFDSLTLRSGSHDSVFYLGQKGQYLRNPWMDESQLAMGHMAPHGRQGHLFINGTYVGLYHVRERFGASFLASYLGGDEDDYEAINANRVIAGSGAAWSAVTDAYGDWEEVSLGIDAANFLDYMILNFYGANDWDWNPEQNWMSAGPSDRTQGGYVFHASDNDICLYYGWDENILDEVGPAWIYQGLLAEAHPDFQVLLRDRLFALLFEQGPLTVDATVDRYQRLAEQIEDAVSAEAARWGGGTWDPKTHWEAERTRLVNGFFPYRTDALIGQVRAAGLYPVDAAEVDTPPGLVAAGAVVTFTAPSGAELWTTTNGEDPRQPGGEPNALATGPADAQEVALAHSAWVSARVRDGAEWGPMRRGLYEVDETPPLVLNEWNAVDADGLLRDEGTDSAFGRIAGNGGDWIELLVLDEHLDLRGWTLVMEDRTGARGTLVLSDSATLADLRRGTLLTIAEDLPEDASYDPDSGDWRLHLRAGVDGGGSFVSATAFDVTSREWQLSAFDQDGWLRFGPVGEGVAPLSGLSGSEVGVLAATPGAAVRRDDPAYVGSEDSTFGAANTWGGGGEQELWAMRGEGGGIWEEPDDTGGDTAPGDTAATADSGDTPGGDSGGAVDDAPGTPPLATGCGCSGGVPPSGLLPLLLPILLLWRRRALVVLLAAGCQTPTPATPGGDTGAASTDTDGGATSDTAGGGDSGSGDGGDVVEGVACWRDLDQDGFGDPDAPRPGCGAGTVADQTDCDDHSSAVHPDAPETCDGEDDDCDGRVDDADDDLVDGLPYFLDGDGDGYGLGQTTACAIASGLALRDGDCDDTDPDIHPDATEVCDEIDDDCDGLAGTHTGSSADCAADTCQAILDEEGAAADGLYWLALPSGETTQVWCDMTTDGGGWTLGFLRNTSGSGNHGDFGAGEESIASLAHDPAAASDSSTAARGWLDLNALDWDTLALGAYNLGSESYRSDPIDRSELRLSFGEDGYLLYGGASGYYWCGGDASYTDSGIGAVDNPPGAPPDCRGHGSLGSGWDFSETTTTNAGLTLCGSDGSNFLAATWGGTWRTYGSAGGAQAIWVR